MKRSKYNRKVRKVSRHEWYRGRVKSFCMAWSERFLSCSEDHLNPAAMTHALADHFKPSVVTVSGKTATVHFPDGEHVEVGLLA